VLARLAPVLIRRRRLVLVAAVLVLAVAGAYGGGVVSSLVGGGFDDPGAQSSRAADVIEATFRQGEPQLVLLARSDGGDVDQPAAASAGQALTERVANELGVVQASSYWSLGSPPPLKSTNGDTALVLVRLEGDDDAVRDRAVEIAEAVEGDDGTLTVAAGGGAIVNEAVSSRVESDLAKAERIALPVTLVLLVIVFGSVVAALLPLAVGIFAIIGTFAVLQVMTNFTDVSIFSLNLTTALGLGLAIDYSLFVVSRFREELANGYETRAAVTRTVRTAGRTVLFSAATVAISLAAMLVFPITFLKSFAYAGIAVAVLAAIGAVVVLPALLAALGPRVNKFAVFHRSAAPPVGQGVWHRIATFVMRRPLPIDTAAIVFLLALGSPFLHIAFGIPDDRVLPPGAPARAVQDTLRNDFTSRESSAVEVVLTDTGDPSARTADIAAYATALSRVTDVARVDALTGSYANGAQVAPPNPSSARFVSPDATWLSVVPSVEPMSSDGEAVVHAVRDVPAPSPALVGGASAELVDTKASLFGRLPLAAAVIVTVTFVVLFLLFGSLLVPLKAVVLNVLSLTATFGAMVWIFQDGHLADLLDFTPTGTIAVVIPILMFCIAFGLSMDYEVFLLSRIKEEHDHGRDTTTSVARGLEHTGRLVTAAAVLIAVVMLAFATSGVAFIKLFGIGLALAVLVDAFIIRATLVPAFMTLAGNANWWAPRWLRRIHDRIGISDTVVLEDEPREPGLDVGHEPESEYAGVGRKD
jgi:putative drug exporter of the RND superfamily